VTMLYYSAHVKTAKKQLSSTDTINKTKSNFAAVEGAA